MRNLELLEQIETNLAIMPLFCEPDGTEGAGNGQLDKRRTGPHAEHGHHLQLFTDRNPTGNVVFSENPLGHLPERKMFHRTKVIEITALESADENALSRDTRNCPEDARMLCTRPSQPRT
jgi:hypothetical protein